MGSCSVFDEDDVGVRYAALKDPSILNQGDASLDLEQRTIRKRLLEFEEHCFQCDDCVRKLRMHQEARFAFERLGERGALRTVLEASTRPSTHRWLAAAACVLFLVAVSLSLWVAALKHQIRKLGTAGAPETVAQLFVLKPPSPLHRSGETNKVRILSPARSVLLSVEVPDGEMQSNRFSARILDAAGNELWKDEDALVDPDGRLFVLLKGGFLASGDYRLDVGIFDRTTGRKKAGATFPFAFERP